jgi:hypothetical protein
MIVRKISLMSTACLIASVLLPMHVMAQDYDGDGTPDALDPCPHIAGATPALLSTPVVHLHYDTTGPGGGDDIVRLKGLGAFFITHAVFDPDSVDNVHITLRRNTTTGADLFATTLAAGPPWTQKTISGRGHQQWNYKGPAPGVGLFKGLLRNALVAPFGSGLNRLTVVKAKDTNIAGPLAGDSVVVTLEIENGFAGLCFAAAPAATCTATLNKDVCVP